VLHEFFRSLLKDRVTAWTIVILLAALYVLICLLLAIWSELVPGFISLFILLAIEILVYSLHRDLAREQPAADTEEYTSMIANIEDVGQKLSDLAVFLRCEREKVEASEQP
jgi:fatty acid desaturase